MDVPIKPIYLFADSQLLFWKKDDQSFLASIKEQLGKEQIRAVYIGASNDDNPEYYKIFEAAMEAIPVSDCHMIHSRFSVVDEVNLNNSDIIVLAGGDVKKGWDVFLRKGIKEAIVRRHYEGAVLIGVSAGAVQLGVAGWPEGELTAKTLVHTFGFVPYVVAVHDEAHDWKRLKRVLRILEGNVRGIGIPAGAGLIYHPDHSLEAIRHPLYEFEIRDDELVQNLLLPPSEESEDS